MTLKFSFLTAAILFSVSSAHAGQAIKIVNLHCVMANGAVIDGAEKGSNLMDPKLAVKTTLFGAQKDFEGSGSVLATGKTRVSLSDKQNLYFVDMSLDANSTDVQSAPATLSMPGAISFYPTYLSSGMCSIKVAWYNY